MLDRAVAFLRGLLLVTPPTDLRRVRDLWGTLAVGRQFRALPLATQREIHAFFTRSAGELLDGWFESEPVKALFGFDAIVGTHASPYTPGSGYVLLHHAFGQVNGKSGVWGHALGGMGAITQAMATEAGSLGVEILREAQVQRVLTENGAATGVELADGRVFEARRVIANVGPKLLFLTLVDRAALPADFVTHLEGWRCSSATFRMNVALAELPRFTGPGPDGHLGAGIIIGPSLAYMDRAYAESRLTGMSREPVIEMLIPSTLDASLAPAGAHVASLFCQHFDYQLPAGRSWLTERDAAAELIIDTVTRYAPNFRASVLGRLALSPLDLEDRFGLTGATSFTARWAWTSSGPPGRRWASGITVPHCGACTCAGRAPTPVVASPACRG